MGRALAALIDVDLVVRDSNPFPYIKYARLVAVGAICALLVQHAAIAADPDPQGPMLLANYYAWYHDGEHPRWPWAGWTRPEAKQNALAVAAQRKGEPPLSSVAYPLIGPYVTVL